MKLSVLKAIFASMEQGVVFIDDQNRIAYCNPAAAKIRNIDADRVLGQSILDWHPRKAHPTVLQIIEDLKSGQLKGHYRMNVHMVEGRFYDHTYSAVWNKNKYLGVIVITYEVTRRKHAEEDLKDALKKLELANEELRRMD